MDGTASTDDWLLDAGTTAGWDSLMGYLATNNLANPAAYDYVKGQVDVGDMIDYVAGQIFVYDSSWFHNRKWWRDRNPGGKWRWCFVDLDRALRTNNLNSNVLGSMASGSRSMAVFRECLSNTEFRAYCAQRIMAHLNSSFSTNRILPIVDREARRIRTEIEPHCSIYGTRGGIPNVAVWDAQVETIRTYVRQRPSIALQQVANFFGTGQTARVQVDAEGGSGRVMANYVELNPAITNIFVAGVPLQLAAVPGIGQSFAHWKIVENTTVPLVATGAVWRYAAATNGIAVEIHQSAANFTDLGFDMALTAFSATTQTFAVADLQILPSGTLDIRAVFAPTGENVLSAGALASNVTLTAAGSPWLATGDIFVPSNTTLSVEAGATLRMPDAASLIVQGELRVLGTTNAPVRIEGNPAPGARARVNVNPSLATSNDLAPRWGGIAFDRATHAGILSNTVIRGASLCWSNAVDLKAAVSALDSDLFIHGVDLDEVQLPIFVQNGNSTILENSR